MKIIGTAGRDGLIVEMDREEFAKMGGFASTYVVRNRFKMEVGLTLDVGNIFNKASAALSLADRTKGAAKTLQENAAELLAYLAVKEEKGE